MPIGTPEQRQRFLKRFTECDIQFGRNELRDLVHILK